MREKEAKILENIKKRFIEIYGINAPKKFKKRFDEECEHYSKNEMSLFYEELLGKIIAKLSLTGIEPVWFEMENSLPYCVEKA